MVMFPKKIQKYHSVSDCTGSVEEDVFFLLWCSPKGCAMPPTLSIFWVPTCRTPGWKSLDSGDLENSMNDINGIMYLVFNSHLRLFKPPSAGEWRHSIVETLARVARVTILGYSEACLYLQIFWNNTPWCMCTKGIQPTQRPPLLLTSYSVM